MEIKSSYLPDNFLKMRQQVVHFVTIPVFFFLFTVLYKPFGADTTLELKYGSFAFNVAIITSIIFVVMVISRLTLWGMRNTVTFKRRAYLVWCCVEAVVACLFISLYLNLISGHEYHFIDLVPIVLWQYLAIMVYPYLILSLLLESDFMARYGWESPDIDASRLRFYDEKHNLKFITETHALLYIESDVNYCNIYYSENGNLKKFTLRCALKSLEENCTNHGIIRCHRSYLVNVKRIKVLRKDRDGLIHAEMDTPNCNPIPVTPRNYEKISGMI